MKVKSIATKVPYKRESLRSKTVRGKLMTHGLGRPFTRKERTLDNILENHEDMFGTYSRQHDRYIIKNPSADKINH